MKKLPISQFPTLPFALPSPQQGTMHPRSLPPPYLPSDSWRGVLPPLNMSGHRVSLPQYGEPMLPSLPSNYLTPSVIPDPQYAPVYQKIPSFSADFPISPLPSPQITSLSPTSELTTPSSISPLPSSSYSLSSTSASLSSSSTASTPYSSFALLTNHLAPPVPPVQEHSALTINVYHKSRNSERRLFWQEIKANHYIRFSSSGKCLLLNIQAHKRFVPRKALIQLISRERKPMGDRSPGYNLRIVGSTNPDHPDVCHLNIASIQKTDSSSDPESFSWTYVIKAPNVRPASHFFYIEVLSTTGDHFSGRTVSFNSHNNGHVTLDGRRRRNPSEPGAPAPSSQPESKKRPLSEISESSPSSPQEFNPATQNQSSSGAAPADFNVLLAAIQTASPETEHDR